MHELFKTTKQGKTTIWYIGEPICTCCEQEITNNTAYFIMNWNSKGSSKQLICQKCITKNVILPVSYSQERLTVYCVEELPNKAIPIFLKPPQLKVSKQDLIVFEGDKIESDKTDNYCKHASFFGDYKEDHGFKIGKSEQELLEDKEEPLDDEQVTKLLEGMK